MLERLTVADFAPLVDQPFEVDLDGLSFHLTLVSATASAGAFSARTREPFALTFLGPLVPPLPQRIHRLRHTRFDTLEIFLVPIGPDARGQRYEAIFS
jgi:hypothetical protein